MKTSKEIKERIAEEREKSIKKVIELFESATEEMFEKCQKYAYLKTDSEIDLKHMLEQPEIKEWLNSNEFKVLPNVEGGMSLHIS